MKRDLMSLPLPLGAELVIDNFAGGGGASTGLERAFGRPVDIAINHDPEAIAMHMANHPHTRHYCESVFDVDPVEVTNNQPVALVWLSPDCKHHSKAKGGKPLDRKIRALAWIALKWAGKTLPRSIVIENVEELQHWTGLIAKRDKKTGRVIKLDGTVALPGEHVAVREQHLIPNPKTRGSHFRRLVSAFRQHGYKVEWLELRGCDYGARTIRRRLFLVARRDHLPIVWPKPSHEAPTSVAVKAGRRPAHRTAAECIDWSIPCPSIFERKRALKDATLRRIAKGLMKFVVNSPNPFVVAFSGDNATAMPGVQFGSLEHAKRSESRFVLGEPVIVRTAHGEVSPSGVQRWGIGAHDVNLPLSTVTASTDFALLAPTLMHLTHQGSDRTADINAPLATVTGAHRGEQALIAAHITKFRHDSIGSAIDTPLHTITAGGDCARPAGAAHAMGVVQTTLTRIESVDWQGRDGLIAPTLIQTGYGEREGQAPRVPGLDKPLGTAVASGVKHAVVSAFLAKHYGGHESAGSSLDDPIGTVTTQDHHHLVTAHIQRDFGQSVGSPTDEPMGTITAGGGGHQALVTGNILKLRGTNIGSAFDEPLHTVSAQGTHHAEVRALLEKYHGEDCLGVVVINGESYVIVDIGMRMLTPRELARAQGFPDSYILDPVVEHDRATGDVRLPDGSVIRGRGQRRTMRTTRQGPKSNPRWVKAPLSKSAQVRMIGNSVCPDVATALVLANFAHEKEMAGAAA